MITARNYASQVETALLKNQVAQIGSLSCNLSVIIKNSQHFAIPDNGLLLNDGWKGIEGKVLNLPYPAITIEYFVAPENNTGAAIGSIATKRLLIAFAHENFNFLNSAMWIPSESKWFSNPAYLKFPVNTVFDNAKGLNFDLVYEGKLSCKEIELTKNNLIMAAPPLMEFLEALSCRNVYTESLEVIDNNKKEKRIKSGKLPLYETKILVVDSKAKEIDATYKGGAHASPRQHLRRGHIRRYTWGNIWINNTLVGKKNNGIIDKSYKIK